MTLPWYKFKNHGNTLWPWWHFLLLFLFSYIRLKGLWRFTQSKSLPYCNKENRQCSQALIDHLLWLQRTLSSRRWESDQYIRSWITYQINANAAVSAWYLVYWLYQNVLVSKGQVFFKKKCGWYKASGTARQHDLIYLQQKLSQIIGWRYWLEKCRPGLHFVLSNWPSILADGVILSVSVLKE